LWVTVFLLIIEFVQYFEKTVVAFETVQVNLPPTLSKAQVQSVRKELKKQLFTLLKIPTAIDLVPQVSTLLTDLGATQSQIQKAMPVPLINALEARKRAAQRVEEEMDDEEGGGKRTKLEDDDDDGAVSAVQRKQRSAIDITADYIYPKLL
jgi:symplekin